MVERACDCAAKIVTGLSKMEGVEVLAHPVLNQGLVAFLDPTGKQNNEWNDHVIAEIAREGTAFFSGTTFRGRRAMRISVTNWQTSQDDVERTLAAIGRVLQQLNSDKVAQPLR